MRKIYICCPYRGDVLGNLVFARKICRKVVDGENIPVCPQLYFPQFLDDDIKEDREMMFMFAFNALRCCDEMWVCGSTISEDMTLEIEFAKRYGIKITLMDDIL